MTTNGVPDGGPRGNAARARYAMLALVFGSVAINYVARGNLEYAAPALVKELTLSPIRMGVIFSAFTWAYAACQIPGGWVADRIGPRALGAVMMGAWSIVTCAIGLARGAAGLIGLRIGMGAFEAPSFPVYSRVATEWFPPKERAGAIGFYISGQFVGLMLAALILPFVEARLGWRGIFVVTGAAGVLYSVVWWMFYRDPKESEGSPRRAPAAEGSPGTRWDAVRAILSSRNMWGVYIGHGCSGAVLWFFLTWFPSYLAAKHSLGLVGMTVSVLIPNLGAFVGSITGGTLSDALVRRGVNASTARKIPVVSGMLLSTSIIGANYTHSQALVVAFMTLSFFGNGFSSLGWAFVSLIAPEGFIGISGGFYNFFGYLAASSLPIAVGVLVAHGGFEPALTLVSALALGGAAAYAFIVRDVQRIELPQTSASGASL